MISRANIVDLRGQSKKILAAVISRKEDFWAVMTNGLCRAEKSFPLAALHIQLHVTCSCVIENMIHTLGRGFLSGSGDGGVASCLSSKVERGGFTPRGGIA